MTLSDNCGYSWRLQRRLRTTVHTIKLVISAEARITMSTVDVTVLFHKRGLPFTVWTITDINKPVEWHDSKHLKKRTTDAKSCLLWIPTHELFRFILDPEGQKVHNQQRVTEWRLSFTANKALWNDALTHDQWCTATLTFDLWQLKPNQSFL